MRCFDRLHPLTALTYFATAIFATMICLYPPIILLSFVFASVLYAIFSGVKKLLHSLAYLLPLMIMIALLNPIFVHKGQTPLFFLNDNPFTLEALLYGINSSVMLAAVYMWFKCMNEILTSDKTIFLFGKTLPKLSILITMIFRFVPELKRKYREIDDAQKALGIYSSKSYVDRIKYKFRTLSALISASLEKSIMTADSMKARGYGLKGRTAYSRYSFSLKDVLIILISLSIGAFLAVMLFNGSLSFYFYPTVKRLEFDVITALIVGFSSLLFGLAAFLEIFEGAKWHLLKSKI